MITHVFLGRFCPLHKGHLGMISTIIKEFGETRVLIVIGSSSLKSINTRTPYTFAVRKKMVGAVFPNVKVIPLADTNNDNVWLNKIGKIEKKLKTKFIFYGGSKNDLKVLAQKFETKVLINRNKNKISGTKVRDAIIKGDWKKIKKMVDKKILPLILKKKS